MDLHMYPDVSTELAKKRRELAPEIYGAFRTFGQRVFADGALPSKTKELIAVGISVFMDCESCMQWHIDQAAACGATRQEVLEAIEVGIEMGAGRVTVSARFALEVMERAFSPKRAQPPGGDAFGGRK